ncbi:hypothetical protein BDZ88DRAFT_421704 [Geranomyces variabilis]|nr:hypothetical protein BDZ88DRAFT_421704 [Geranomyces variabilis]
MRSAVSWLFGLVNVRSTACYDNCPTCENQPTSRRKARGPRNRSIILGHFVALVALEELSNLINDSHVGLYGILLARNDIRSGNSDVRSSTAPRAEEAPVSARCDGRDLGDVEIASPSSGKRVRTPCWSIHPSIH